MRDIVFDKADIYRIIGRLEGMSGKMLPKTEVRKIKVRAAKIIEYKVKSKVHDSGRVRKRFKAVYVSGNLRQSVKVLPLRKRELVYLGIQVVKKAEGVYGMTRGKVNAWYGHFVEYGTAPYKGRKGQRAQFYFHRGVKEGEDEAVETMKKEIMNRFEAVRW